MEWEQQKDDLLSALKNLEANFYYFNDQENDDIRTNLIKLESKKTDEDLSEIKKFQEQLTQKLNRIKVIYQHPYYLIKPSTVVKIGDAFRKVLQLDNTTHPLDSLVESLASSGGHYQKLYDEYINGNLSGIVHVKSDKPIRPYAFYGFSNITEISAPNTTGTGKSAFVGCNGLKVFYAPKASTYNKGFGSDPLQFTHFTAGFDLYSVSKSKITYTAWGSDPSKYLNPCFTKNKIIEMISLPGIFHIGQEAFSGCTKLVSAYFKRTVWDYNPDTTPPEAGTEPATSHVDGVIGSKAFADCTSLKTIEAPYFKTLKAEVFKKCTSLSSVSLPRVTEVGEKAFTNCTKLTHVSLPKCTTLAKNAFTGCDKLISINIGTKSTSNIFSAKTTLQTIVMSKATTINESAFKGLKNLTTISFPKATVVGKHAFNGCEKITVFDSPLVTTVQSSAFSGCKELTFVNISNCTEIQAGAFAKCEKLTDIIAPALVSIDKLAFSDCSAITNIYAPQCKNLEESPFNTGNLIDLVLGEDKALSTVFGGVKAVQRLSLANCTEVGANAFDGYGSLSYVYLPKCTKIGKLAFNGCTNLKYIVLPAVTTISANAFNGCTSLEEVVLLSSKKVTLEANALPTQAKIFVRDESLEQDTRFDTIPVLTKADGSFEYLEIFDVQNDTQYSECYQEFINPNDRSLNDAHIGTIDSTPEIGSETSVESYIRGFYLNVPFYKPSDKIVDKSLKNKYDWKIESNGKYTLEYNKDNTCYIYDQIAVESSTMYQIPKCTSLLQLNVNKKIIGGEFTFEEGTQYKIKTDQACKYLVLKFDTNKIKNSDVKLYEINWYNHKHFYEIKDNKFIVGPRYMYDETLKTYKKVNIVKYLYRLSGKYQDNFWSRSPVKINFGTKTANGQNLSNYTFIIDNRDAYIDTDPELYEKEV